MRRESIGERWMERVREARGIESDGSGLYSMIIHINAFIYTLYVGCDPEASVDEALELLKLNPHLINKECVCVLVPVIVSTRAPPGLHMSSHGSELLSILV